MEDVIRSAVEQHSCEVFGTRYSLRVEWVDVEQGSSPDSTRYLLRVEFCSLQETTKAPTQLHILVWLTDVSELPALLDDALNHHLFEQVMVTAPDRSWRRALQDWADAARPVWRHQLWRRGSGLTH